MVLDIPTNTYKPVLDLDYQARIGWRYWLCVGGCIAGATAIASVDGPVSAMDILALTWVGAAIFVYEFGDCMDWW